VDLGPGNCYEKTYSRPGLAIKLFRKIEILKFNHLIYLLFKFKLQTPKKIRMYFFIYSFNHTKSNNKNAVSI
jgi:hypothetical protein